MLVHQNETLKGSLRRKITLENTPHRQIDELDSYSQQVYDIIKWNTILKYILVGYAEKDAKILFTYIKNDNDSQVNE